MKSTKQVGEMCIRDSYTMDLNRAALLQTWRGQFADVTEMWYERGEPQLLETAGLTVPVSGQSSYAVLASNAAAWPDSSDLNLSLIHI